MYSWRMYAQVPVSSEHGESVTSNDVLAIVRTPALAVLMVGLEVVGMARALSGALATDCAAPCPTPRIGLLSLCAASDEATEIHDDVALFQAILAALNKIPPTHGKTPEQIDIAVRQLVSKAITTDGGIIDIFAAAGIKKPDISILDDRFLAEVRGLKNKNVAAELLEKLLKDKIKNPLQTQPGAEPGVQ
jgi:hypothetical protein